MYEEEYENEDLVYAMKDPTEFINQIRRLVFAGFGSEKLNDDELEHLVLEINEEEMDSTISFNECKIIAMEYLKPKKIRRKIKYFLTEQGFTDLVEAVNARLVSNILTELVDEGKLESAWDSEANDFIFWVKEDESH
jgi:hypothetical protein